MLQKPSFLSNKRMHIFIADDDPDDILFLKEAFKEISKNIKITSAKNGQELLKFVQLVIPNLIVLDINMPCMDGLDCLEELRRSKRLGSCSHNNVLNRH